MEKLFVLYPALTSVIILLAIIFRKGNKRILWVLTLFYLFAATQYVKVIGSLINYALPETAILTHRPPLYLPFIIGILILSLGFPLIFTTRSIPNPPENNKISNRWLWLTLSIITPVIGLSIFLLSIYYPGILGSTNPQPHIGVYSHLAIGVISALIIYKTSFLNSQERPNLFRWLSTLWLMALSITIVSMSLILLYVIPGPERLSYTFLASLMTITIFCYAASIVGIAKGYIVKQIKPEIV